MKLSDFGIGGDGTHSSQLTHEENIFLSILWVDHVGEGNAIPADELAIIFAQRRTGIYTAGLGSKMERAELKWLLYLMQSTRSHRRQLDRWKRDVRKMHNHLLNEHDHIPLLSRAGHGGGYWIAEDHAEMTAFYESFRKRGLTGLVKASRGKKAVLVDMVSQLSFDFHLDDRTGEMQPVRPGSGVSMPVQVVDQFLERMLAEPEKFADDLRRISNKFGNVLFSKAQARAMKVKILELNELAAGL